MRTHEHLSQFRNKTHPQYGSTDESGMNGFFVIPMDPEQRNFALVIASEGNEQMPWEHVSARIGEKHNGKLKERTPHWWEMCVLKKLFFKDDEVVMQLHPKEEDYVNLHPFVLHLWRPKNQEIPTPPKIFV
jgi:hypothetical protein